MLGALPQWLYDRLNELGLLDLPALQQRLTESATQVGQYLAPQAINIGQNTLGFLVSFGIMLYLLFFLLRDGPGLAIHIRRAIRSAEEPETTAVQQVRHRHQGNWDHTINSPPPTKERDGTNEFVAAPR